MRRRDADFDELWNTTPEPGDPLKHSALAGLPEPARRYLRHAIAEGAPLASAVRLRMHGTFRLRGRWCPFEAEQVLRAQRGFVWRATLKVHGIPISGSDRWVDGAGKMMWSLLGLVPVARGEGPDVSRSAAGRAQIESVFLPSALFSHTVRWRARDEARAIADVRLGDQTSEIELGLNAEGGLRDAAMLRWGTPDGDDAPFREARFGCLVEAERTFGAFTIPSVLRVGWHVGTEHWEEGEFFRVTIEEARFR